MAKVLKKGKANDVAGEDAGRLSAHAGTGQKRQGREGEAKADDLSDGGATVKPKLDAPFTDGKSRSSTGELIITQLHAHLMAAGWDVVGRTADS